MYPARTRAHDLRTLQRASVEITELGAQLDWLLAQESRPEERLRMLRETTNRITRVANDAIAAYRRSARAVELALAKPHADVQAATDLRQALTAARRELLDVLEVAGRRYPQSTAPPSKQREPVS